MASNNGYLTHCRICGTPIFSLGNRQFCSACYAQNRRNAAHRSNGGTNSDGTKFPDHLPEGFPKRRVPPEHPWVHSAACHG